MSEKLKGTEMSEKMITIPRKKYDKFLVGGDVIEHKEVQDHLFVLQYDINPINPRDEGNLGRMFCLHKRYNLGDDCSELGLSDNPSSEFASWEDIEEYICDNLDVTVIKSLYLLDHSGITISQTPFGCPWDSCQVGFHYARESDIKEWLGTDNLSGANTLEEVSKIMLQEVEEYDKYLRGDKYMLAIYDEERELLIVESIDYEDFNDIDYLHGIVRELKHEPDIEGM